MSLFHLQKLAKTLTTEGNKSRLHFKKQQKLNNDNKVKNK